MKPKMYYLILCVLGLVIPYSQFLPWILHHGLNLPLFVHELFATRIGAFFAMDVIVSAVTLVAFMRMEGRRLGIRRRWIVIVALLTVGVSLALPVFLLLREVQLERTTVPLTA